MYANSLPFEANLTLQTRNNFRDASFSSYLNKAEENMVRKLTKKPEEDEEISVFGAEKYFKGEIEDGGKKIDLRFIDSNNKTQQDNKVEEFDHSFPSKLKDGQTNIHTPSVRSNVSCNSRSSLLPRNGNKTRTFLARFGCDCMNKKSTQINEKIFIHPESVQTNIRTPSVRSNASCKTDLLSSKLAETRTRNDYFSFPVLNSTDQNSISSSNSKSGNSAGKVEVNNNGGRLGKKLSLLNDWDTDMDIETDEMYISSSRMYNNDADSDSSSDLFEIESFSPAGNGHQKTESNYYAPSEVSIEWSVVTASAADFSLVSDYEDVIVRTGGGGRRNSGQVKNNKDEQKKRPGIISGCASHKAVRVAGDECKVGGGAAGGRRRLSDSPAVGGMVRGGII